MKPKVLAFDLNQTLTNFEPLRPVFGRLFGDATALDQWFSLLLHYAMVVTLTESYDDFRALGQATLKMLAVERRVELREPDKAAVFQAMTTLPAHSDAPEALDHLRRAGFRTIVLTNSPASSATTQVKNAGLDKYFDELISVDSVRKFKPAPEVYRFAAGHMGVERDEMMLIAAHAWDVYGALRAGCRAAYIKRGGKPPFSLGPQPEISAPNLKAFAHAVLK